MLELLARHDSMPESICLHYDAPWTFFAATGIEGGAGYIESHGHALVWCDPVCTPDGRAEVLAQLTHELRRRKLRICLLIVSGPFAQAALDNGYAVLKIGEEPLFDLERWRMPRGDPGKHLRWCLNAGRRAGLAVTELPRADDARLAEVTEAWESGLARTVSRSFLRTDPLAQRDRKRIFVATRGGRLESFLACATVNGGRDWFLEDLVRRPDSPVGATELVVVEALAQLRAGGAARASLDIAPLRGSDEQLDRRARRLLAGLRPLLNTFDRRYHFRARAQYAAKFVPSEWRPRYVALYPSVPTLGLIRAVRATL